MARDQDRPALPPALPVVDQPPAERADAARNRHKILAAAEEIVATDGVEHLTMNDLAAAAGVGVGTVYRRFGDLAGVIDAMMNERENQLQQAFMAGPPPLGPGAPPADRVRAFLHSYVDLLDTYGDLLAAAETTTPSLRYRGAYAVHHIHLVTLISEANPGLDAQYLADTLLAAVAASHFVHQRRHRKMSVRRIKTGLDTLLDCLLQASR
ncbi:TetR/AcrR family transcriptional regulator [Amycolatopsis nigrescens]|uniref:TetR/AcrR family transcriptional regulator n=1 Tax=Amycolatopsis nigrescens TaxID=381445 RepID=UPI00037ACD30|nr:TetR/AcrR family transcriptional regulator [Amycolatopsis nigrescens]